ncbi:hypothetical protein AgCh_020559 [Apium graveolens]
MGESAVNAPYVQNKVSVGMGLLAGFTVMLLTVIWGTCIVVGKCDIEDFVAIDGKDTKWLSLTGDQRIRLRDTWRTRYDPYEFLVMSFGLINAPAVLGNKIRPKDKSADKMSHSGEINPRRLASKEPRGIRNQLPTS